MARTRLPRTSVQGFEIVLVSAVRVSATLATALCLASPAVAESVAPRPPDFSAGLAATLQQALAEGSNGALIEFIARNPDEAVTDTARQALAGRRSSDAMLWPGPDGEIIAAFDAARLTGDPAAMRSFAETHAAHPLGQEALRDFWNR